jgi:hypothetical protein
MDQFNLDYQFNLYLKRCRITKEEMHPVQYEETKKAFMGACGQLLVLLTYDLVTYEEEVAHKKLDDMIEQVNSFWINEIKKEI